MNKLNYISIYDSFFKVKKSYQQNFNFLTEEELVGLQHHNFFLKTVHKEMKDYDNEPDVSAFTKNLSVIQNKGQNFRGLCQSVFNKDSGDTKNNFTSVFFNKNTVTSKEFNLIWERLTEKSDKDMWSTIHNSMYQDANTLKLETTKSLVKGLSLKDIDSYDRTEEAVHFVANLVEDIWTSIDFAHLLTLCKTNEKFVFILVFPYFYKVLEKYIWPTLFSMFHFVSNSFSTFLQKVSTLLKQGSNISATGFRTTCVKGSVK